MLHRDDNQMIVDNAHMLNKDTVALVNQQNQQALNTPLQGQIVIVTVKSIDGESVDEYARELLQQSDWQKFPGKYNVVTLILFAQNNLNNNVRVSTTRNARSLISDDQAVGYLKENYDDLKSNRYSRINNGLQHVAVSVNNAMASGTFAQLKAQQEADRKEAEEQELEAQALAICILGGFVLLIITFTIYSAYAKFIEVKFNKLLNTTENQQWLKNNKLPESELSFSKNAVSVVSNIYAYSNKSNTYYGYDNEPCSQLERILDWLSHFNRFDMLTIDDSTISLTAHRKYVAFKKLALELKDVSWQKMGIGYKSSYNGKLMYVTEGLLIALKDPSIEALDKLKFFDYSDLEEYHKTFGVQADYDNINSLSDDTYNHLFPTKKIYKKYLNGDLPKRNEFDKNSDGSYAYSSSDSDDLILSSIIYSDIYSGSSHSGEYYDSGYSSSDSGGFSDGGGGSI